MRALFWLLSLLVWPTLASAQDESIFRSPILVIDTERLISQSVLGQRLNAAIDAEKRDLSDENRRIAAELNAEEQALTAQRPLMKPADFRKLAEDFDVKVRRLREEQDTKERALARRIEQLPRQFLGAAEQVFAQLLQERGAIAIQERRSLLVFAQPIDVTDEAIALINAQAPQLDVSGQQGEGATATPPIPETGAETGAQPDAATPQGD